MIKVCVLYSRPLSSVSRELILRKLGVMLIAVAISVCTAVPAFASGSAVDQFSAVKYIRNLSDLASQYRDHGLSLQLDGHNYEWLIFSDSMIRRNMEAELILLGRSREHTESRELAGMLRKVRHLVKIEGEDA